MVSSPKASLRKEMLSKRNAISESELMEKSAAIAEKLFALSEFRNAKTVAFYISKGSEVNTFEIIGRAVREGKEVLVPITFEGREEMEFVRFVSFDDLRPAQFGILEPQIKIKPKSPQDVVIVPGVAFDLDLHRLGYGKGYYDRLFKELRAFKVGICFDFQIVDKIPRHEHDERLDLIISEKRILGR